jgi:hypothetical protein
LRQGDLSARDTPPLDQHPKNASFTGKAKTFWDNVKGV